MQTARPLVRFMEDDMKSLEDTIVELEEENRALKCLIEHFEKKAERERENRKKWNHCKLCNDPNPEPYMVKDETWYEAGFDKPGGIICLMCLEKALRRELSLFDFTPVPLNHPILFGWKMAKRSFGNSSDIEWERLVIQKWLNGDYL